MHSVCSHVEGFVVRFVNHVYDRMFLSKRCSHVVCGADFWYLATRCLQRYPVPFCTYYMTAMVSEINECKSHLFKLI